MWKQNVGNFVAGKGKIEKKRNISGSRRIVWNLRQNIKKDNETTGKTFLSSSFTLYG